MCGFKCGNTITCEPDTVTGRIRARSIPSNDAIQAVSPKLVAKPAVEIRHVVPESSSVSLIRSAFAAAGEFAIFDTIAIPIDSVWRPV